MTVPKYPIGTQISKAFDGISYKGKIISFDSKEGYYKVKYDDGDQEELDHEEVEQYLVLAANSEDDSVSKQSGSGAKMSSSQMIGSLPAINTTSTAPIKSYVTSNPVPVAAIAPNMVAPSSGSGSCCKRRQVAHSYHDHSQDMPSMAPHITRGGVKTPFPMRLHNMLNGTEAEGLTHIVSWQPHGRSFLVHKAKEFLEDVMPRYFKQGKFASFQRQLNLYGFKRLTRGPDAGSYYNELFLRGRPFLARDIHRTKIKGKGARAASNPDAEPNFYTMPSLDYELVVTENSSSSKTSEAKKQKPKSQEKTPRRSPRNATAARPAPTVAAADSPTTITIPDAGPIGCTLRSKDGDASVFVEKVKENSLAQRAGVQVGDVPVDSMGGAIAYDEFKNMCVGAARPLVFRVRRA